MHPAKRPRGGGGGGGGGGDTESAPSPRPRPWRACDDEQELGFVFDSVARRLSGIVARVACSSSSNAELGLGQVAKGLQEGTLVVEELDGKEDGGPDWTQFVRDEVLASGGKNTAFQVGWFFLENYVYRLIAGKTGFFRGGADPFAKDKAEALRVAEPVFLAMPRHDTDTFPSLVEVCLWGNKADLSLSVGVVSAKDSKATRGELLVDDTAKCWADLQQELKARRARDHVSTVVLVLDNCGIELLADLRLAAFLIRKGFHVALHCKAYPVFVSDAIPADVTMHLEWLFKHDLCLDLRDNPKLSCVPHTFYCSPKFLDEEGAMPQDLITAWSEAVLVICKGDANYRRLVRDCARDSVSFPFDKAMGFSLAAAPVRVLAIRTCKSPVAVGLDESVVARVRAGNPNWCTDGSCGVVQYCVSGNKSHLTA